VRSVQSIAFTCEFRFPGVVSLCSSLTDSSGFCVISHKYPHCPKSSYPI
jgi:acetyl esterase/lipase